ncbi:aquaporin AQPcic-like [Nylanderia fulva]|uniref:aquaporin AQPcic-like n=1 Tax=Nylanderia fulva TaxID=613905 RepID=UPI0010FAF54C|nr:aquaporin AQPcic-like [Nylanderia fulva]XP_029179063.1 aquaporin AQPcic-like [Nylanderia fulva]XP_029179064.1 aquaporin AQPcic-like [Nylanderia fulva]
MEQNGISTIISPSENSGKSKNIGITLRSNGSFQSAKEKFKAPWKKMEEDSTWDKLVAVLGEVIGTAMLVFLGCAICVGSLGHPLHAIQIPLAFGLAVMIAIQSVGHISGAHLNPAVTLATVILGKTTLAMAGFYVIAQCLGSLIGFGLLKMITPSNYLHDGDPDTKDSFCTTHMNENIQDLTFAHGFGAEALATGILVFVACSIWDSRNAKNTDSVPIKFGLTITMLAFAFVPYTGCSMNPARSFGPAVWNNYWNHHWLYWVGPLVGSAIATLIYRFLFSPKTKNQHDSETFNDVEA